MAPTTTTCIVEHRSTWTASSKALSPLTSRLSSPLRSSSLSTCRPPRRLRSRCRCLCSFALTTCSNEARYYLRHPIPYDECRLSGVNRGHRQNFGFDPNRSLGLGHINVILLSNVP